MLLCWLPNFLFFFFDFVGQNRASELSRVVYGEELYADGTHRIAAGKYSQTGEDGVRQRFTGYQKDKETSLDFAEARMYANSLGRFTAVDPLLASGKSANPQTFNRYVYVGNSPLLLTDPDGLQAAAKPESPPDGASAREWATLSAEQQAWVTRMSKIE